MSPGESYFFPASPGSSSRSAGGSDLDYFQINASSLGLGSCEILCASFNSAVSISHSSLALPKVSSPGLQRQMFGELILLRHVPELQSPRWDPDPCSLWRICICNHAVLADHLTGGMGLDYTVSLFLTIKELWYISLVIDLSVSFQVILINSFSVNSYNFGVAMGGGKLRIFLLCHLCHLLHAECWIFYIVV